MKTCGDNCGTVKAITDTLSGEIVRRRICRIISVDISYYSTVPEPYLRPVMFNRIREERQRRRQE